jgi:hypothetical protein
VPLGARSLPLVRRWRQAPEEHLASSEGILCADPRGLGDGGASLWRGRERMFYTWREELLWA